MGNRERQDGEERYPEGVRQNTGRLWIVAPGCVGGAIDNARGCADVREVLNFTSWVISSLLRGH